MISFSSHRKKRMKELQKKINRGLINAREDDPFDLFISSTNIRYTYYKETHKVLGNTYGMCVLQVSQSVPVMALIFRFFAVYFLHITFISLALLFIVIVAVNPSFRYLYLVIPVNVKNFILITSKVVKIEPSY